MYCLIAAEVAIFTIFVIAYIFYIGKSVTGPQPRDVLHVPIFLTVCLLSSSLTIHFAVRLLRSGRVVSFGLWWLLTIVLGSIFLLGTFREWRELITRGPDDPDEPVRNHLLLPRRPACISRHGRPASPCGGMVFTLRGDVGRQHAERTEVLSMYWHFVDVVWVVVFTVVYIVGR